MGANVLNLGQSPISTCYRLKMGSCIGPGLSVCLSVCVSVFLSSIQLINKVGKKWTRTSVAPF